MPRPLQAQVIRLVSGPAHSIWLRAMRTPPLLRVVRNDIGQHYALDGLDEKPLANETVFVYRRHGTEIRPFNDRDGRGPRRGEAAVVVEYRHVSNGPAESVLRDTTSWRQWATEYWRGRQQRRTFPVGGRIP